MLIFWIILSIYLSMLGLLTLYGLHRMFLLRSLRRPQARSTRWKWESAPLVTVQLPLYNEAAVVTRLIDAVARLDWPTARLQIQVLDDSTDATSALALRAAEDWRKKGLNIQVIRRPSRTGYKAGALAHGLTTARGEFIAIFDADFVPEPDFLHQLMPSFSEGVGMVQARWGHLNRHQRLLTRLQAMLLDGHFVIEHAARHHAGHFFNFNGTAGIWRRACIDDAGGWAHDTITEDLDLSYRAQLKGWRFVFRSDVVVPAEIPRDMPAFLTQQHRWAKGGVQTARKLLGQVLRAEQPAGVKLEATVHLTSPIGYPLMVLLAVLLPPTIAARSALGLHDLQLIDLLVILSTTGSMTLFFGTALTRQGRPLLQHIWEIPLTMALGAGMAISQGLAVLEGLTNDDVTFVRTPKHGTQGTMITRGGDTRPLARMLTLCLALYYAAAIPWAIHEAHWGSLPFMLLFACGFWGVGLGLLPDLRLGPTAARTETGQAPAAK